MSADLMLRIEGLRKNYGAVAALQGVDIDIRRGEVMGLIGPNGSGKSTLLRILLGSLRPERGTVRIFGTDPASFDARWHLCRRLGSRKSDSQLP